MKESSVYQMIIERGREQGAKAFATQRILKLLNRRFNVNPAPAFAPALEAIEDLEHLDQLLDAASEAERLENFMQALEEIGK